MFYLFIWENFVKKKLPVLRPIFLPYIHWNDLVNRFQKFKEPLAYSLSDA